MRGQRNLQGLCLSKDYGIAEKSLLTHNPCRFTPDPSPPRPIPFISLASRELLSTILLTSPVFTSNPFHLASEQGTGTFFIANKFGYLEPGFRKPLFSGFVSVFKTPLFSDAEIKKTIKPESCKKPETTPFFRGFSKIRLFSS